MSASFVISFVICEVLFTTLDINWFALSVV